MRTREWFLFSEVIRIVAHYFFNQRIFREMLPPLIQECSSDLKVENHFKSTSPVAYSKTSDRWQVTWRTENLHRYRSTSLFSRFSQTLRFYYVCFFWLTENEIQFSYYRGSFVCVCDEPMVRIPILNIFLGSTPFKFVQWFWMSKTAIFTLAVNHLNYSWRRRKNMAVFFVVLLWSTFKESQVDFHS